MSLFATDRERTILRLFKNNTPQAMSILYDEYAGWLTAVCSRYVVNEEDRKDVLQESFIRIFKFHTYHSYLLLCCLHYYYNKNLEKVN